MEQRPSFRVQYQGKLDQIQADVLKAGAEATEMVREATEAALSGDPELCAAVIAKDDAIDEAERRLVNLAVLAMLEAPVAADLRLLVCTFGVMSEIEKVGDDAAKLARRASRLGASFPSEFKLPLIELSEKARHAFSASLRLYSSYSNSFCAEIIAGDKAIDKTYSAVRKRALDLIKEQPSSAEDLLRTAESFRALEHVADRATAVANHMKMIYEPV
ncbi:MAG: phosphate signaling complex PhoU family protein [Fimbriimonas sp.]